MTVTLSSLWYGAPKGSCEIHIYIYYIIAFARNTIAFPRNDIAFSRNIISFSRNNYCVPSQYFCVLSKYYRNTNEIAFLVCSPGIGISFPRNSISYPQNKPLFRYIKISLFVPSKTKYFDSLEIVLQENTIVFRCNAILF